MALLYYELTNLSERRVPAEALRLPPWIAAAVLVSCVGLAFFVEWRVWVAGLALLGLGFIARAWMRGRAL